MRIIVHFGMYKTGSTSIQKTLYQNRTNINVYYPDFGRYDHIVTLSSDLSLLKKKLELNSSTGRDVILSAEGLIGFSAKKLKALHALLSEYAEEVIAVGYVRAPKSYMESAFQEALKGGFIKSFKILHKRFRHYQTSFAKFDRIFGQENVYFWKFDPATFPNGCVVRDFCQRLNISISPDSIVRVNEGFSIGAVSLLYAYSKYAQKFNFGSITRKDLQLLIEKLAELKGKKLYFASELIEPLCETIRPHIDWMEIRMGSSLVEDLTKNDQDAIHSEAQLLSIAPETTQWLAEQLGANYLNSWHPQMTAQEVAKWVHLLSFKLTNEAAVLKRLINEEAALQQRLKKSKENKTKNSYQLVKQTKRTVSELAGLPEEKAALLIREVSKRIAHDLETINEGILTIAGLGQFKVSQTEQDKKGQKIVYKQVIFELAKDKNNPNINSE